MRTTQKRLNKSMMRMEMMMKMKTMRMTMSQTIVIRTNPINRTKSRKAQEKRLKKAGIFMK